MAEKWALFDINRLPLHEYANRGEDFPNGKFHIVIHACIFNSKGEMLIQHRQPFKEGWSNRWDVTVGGSAVGDETSSQALIREVEEEIGLKLPKNDYRPSLTMNFQYGFDDFYLIEMDVDQQTLHLQYEEVQAVKWASYEEVLRMLEDGRFIAYHRSLIELLFALRHQMGAHVRWE